MIDTLDTSLDTSVDRFLDYLVSEKGLLPRTVDAYGRDLRGYVDTLEDSGLIVRMDAKARRLLRNLFEVYLAEPEVLPQRFRSRIPDQGIHRVACDYVAGMTDRFAQEEHRRLFAPFHFE